MKPEIAEKWIAALRSGRYKQGRGALQDNGKFCCLGVLCEIAIKEGVLVDAHKTMHGQVIYGGNGSTLPLAVREWADVKYGTGSIVLADAQEISLVTLNDDTNVVTNFAEIADVIERHAAKI